MNGTTDKPSHRRELGQKAESAAAAFLENRGWKILERNWRRERCEIDIIADDGEHTLVFVEVKSSTGKIPPETKIDAVKIQNLNRAAECYLREKSPSCSQCRFDLIAMRKSGENWIINHFQDAFRP